MRHRPSHLAGALWCLLVAVPWPTSASAQIARLEILSRTTVNDPAFGPVGAYEIIKGRAHGSGPSFPPAMAAIS